MKKKSVSSPITTIGSKKWNTTYKRASSNAAAREIQGEDSNKKAKLTFYDRLCKLYKQKLHLIKQQ